MLPRMEVRRYWCWLGWDEEKPPKWNDLRASIQGQFVMSERYTQKLKNKVTRALNIWAWVLTSPDKLSLATHAQWTNYTDKQLCKTETGDLFNMATLGRGIKSFSDPLSTDMRFGLSRKQELNVTKQSWSISVWPCSSLLPTPILVWTPVFLARMAWCTQNCEIFPQGQVLPPARTRLQSIPFPACDSWRNLSPVE